MSKPSGKFLLLRFEEDTFGIRVGESEGICVNFIRYYSTFIVQYLTLSMKHIFTLHLRECLLRGLLCNELRGNAGTQGT